MRPLAIVYRVQRAVLGVYGLVAGALGLAMLVMPRVSARGLLGLQLTSLAVGIGALFGAMRLGCALVALVTAYVPKPPRALVWSLAIALALSALGLWFATIVDAPPRELKPLWRIAGLDGACALLLFASIGARRVLGKRSAQ
jgi:hypothetical protein